MIELLLTPLFCALDFSTIQAVYDTNLADSFLLEVAVKRYERIQQTENYILFCMNFMH